MLAFSIDYYGIFFGATQSVELFCTYGIKMKINDFKENNENKKEVMEKKMEALKLENINSMWYFIVATLKAVVGSKGH